jgi:hypothetical protein
MGGLFGDEDDYWSWCWLVAKAMILSTLKEVIMGVILQSPRFQACSLLVMASQNIDQEVNANWILSRVMINKWFGS